VTSKLAAPGWPHSPANDGRPLNGLRVLDLSRIVAGPLCAMLLADLGADVVKVEGPAGDEIRNWGPPFLGDQATYYYVPNKNKWLLTLDLNSDADQLVVAELISAADVLIHNFTADIARSLRVDFGHAADINPRLIYLTISGFGPAMGNRPGFDLVAQAMSGLMSITGNPESGPSKVGVAISDIASAHYAAMGILAVVAQRGIAGIRARRPFPAVQLDVALQDASIALLTNRAANWLLAGVDGRLRGNDDPSVAPYGVYATGDGVIALAVGTDRQFEKLCRALGQDELVTDARFADNAGRLRHGYELRVRLEGALAGRSAWEWHELLDAQGVPNGAIRSVSDAVEDPACELVGTIEDTDGQRLRLLSTPVRIDGLYYPPYIAPERPGAHESEILGRLGITSEPEPTRETQPVGEQELASEQEPAGDSRA
jgi:crotonobetainyl-CoA:carnitine CoA-transferase CaiB-like acyl-CoA transferase